MTDDHSPAIVRAIREAFTRSDPDTCYCHGSKKFSEDELLEALVQLHHVAVADTRQQNALPLDVLTPDEIWEHCANELMIAGQQLLRHSATLIRYGCRSFRRVKVGLALKKTVRGGIGSLQRIEAAAYALHEIERSEIATPRLPKPCPRIPAAGRQRNNVITGAFSPPVKPPDPASHGRRL